MRTPTLFIFLALVITGCERSSPDKSQSPVFGSCVNGLRMLDGSKQQWALEHGADSNAVPTWDDLNPYVARHREDARVWLRCPLGGTYTIGRVADPVTCSIMTHNLCFGMVSVADETHHPLTGARITVIDLNGREIRSVQTGTNDDKYDGFACTHIDPTRKSGWWKSATEVVVTKDGYHSERTALPTNYWPLMFTLRSEAK